jgi:TolB-like protein/class 3 adenylate cyclase
MAKDNLSAKLAVILHADIAESTMLVQQDERLAHERIQDTFRRFSKTIGIYQGRVRELRGDALLADFERPSDAVTAALAFQADHSCYIEQLNDDIRPAVRVGIAMGEVIIADSTVTGAGVVLAQRVEQLSESGGVCITAAIHEGLPKRLPFDQEDMGERQVKGFDETVRFYAVSLKPGGVIPKPEALAYPESAGSAVSDKPSIAVLPFDNMSGDPEQEYFADGITEDITTALSHFSGLFVIARNSSFTYKGHAVDTRKISSELGVRYVLEGSVRRSGKRIRISGQLINALTSNHIWAEKFDGDLDDIFELQDEITRKIVSSIAPQIELTEVERGRGLQTANLSSYELSLKAKSQIYDALLGGNAEQLQLAIDTAKAALALDSRNTHALWVQGMAQMDQYIYQWGEDPKGALKRALRTADNLLLVDSANADGYGLRGTIHTMSQNFDLALTDFSRALSLNPNAATNLFLAAMGESLAGETARAKEHAFLGLHLSPRERGLWLGVAYLALTQASFAEEDFEEAMKWGRLSIQMHSKAPMRRVLMVACCAYNGDFEQAAVHAAALEEFSPTYIPSILRGDLLIYKTPGHNNLLVEGLRKAGMNE